MHCASHGEFEQGRPLLEALKEQFPSSKIILTFFSPSGMEHAAWEELTNAAHYLPPDNRKNARQFLDLVQPDLVFFVKYELWYHYLLELDARNIPTILVAANFRTDQVFFRWYGGLYRRMLAFFDLILVQYPESAGLLEKIGIRHCQVCGDPRFERASEIAATPYRNEVLEAFCDEKKVLIAGSTWPPDEALLFRAFSSEMPEDWKLVIVPHELDSGRMKQWVQKWPQTLLYSEAVQSPESVAEARTLIVDKMGLLSRIYRYGTAAFIGGAVGGTGLHNIIEPAAYGLPLLFGKHCDQYPEARQMINAGIAEAIESSEDISSAIKSFEQEDKLKKVRSKAKKLFEVNAGVTKKMLEHLQSKGLLPIKKPTSKIEGSQLI